METDFSNPCESYQVGGLWAGASALRLTRKVAEVCAGTLRHRGVARLFVF